MDIGTPLLRPDQTAYSVVSYGNPRHWELHRGNDIISPPVPGDVFDNDPEFFQDMADRFEQGLRVFWFKVAVIAGLALVFIVGAMLV
jgi:hypothetical protein